MPSSPVQCWHFIETTCNAGLFRWHLYLMEHRLRELLQPLVSNTLIFRLSLPTSTPVEDIQFDSLSNLRKWIFSRSAFCPWTYVPFGSKFPSETIFSGYCTMHYNHQAFLHIIRKWKYLNSLLFKLLAWLANISPMNTSIFKLPLDKMHKQFKGECILSLISIGEWQNPSLKCIQYLPFPVKKQTKFLYMIFLSSYIVLSCEKLHFLKYQFIEHLTMARNS